MMNAQVAIKDSLGAFHHLPDPRELIISNFIIDSSEPPEVLI